MLPILCPGKMRTCFSEVSKGLTSHSPIGFGRVSIVMICLVGTGNAKTLI